MGVCLWVSVPRFIQFALGSCYVVHINAYVNIMKAYIERNNIQVELIRFRKNIDFIDGGNFEVGNFRDRRVYEIGLIAIRDVSPLFCAVARKAGGGGKGFRLSAFPTGAGSSHGKSVQAPIRFVILHSVYDSRSTHDRG